MRNMLLICALLEAATLVQAEVPASPVRLAVVIVVDQMRPDYLDRFADLYTGGLARLQREGAVFRHAYHDHSCTLTGPGHATLSTGCVPAHHGITGNDFYDRHEGREVYCCGDTTESIVGLPELAGVSPGRLLRPTAAELIQRGRPGAKVVSVGLKDRAAMLLAGRTADAVLWYEYEVGRFVTSTWYDSAYPSWVLDFNTSGYIEQFADSTWNRLLPDSAYARSGADRVEYEYDGKHTEFPHPCNPEGSAPDKPYYLELYYVPYGDRITLELATRATAALNLGHDSVPDLLLVSCSAADAIGHRYGPNSHEVQDYYLRLDRYLAEFFDSLDSTVGKDQWLVAVASDHGVMPLPELEARKGVPVKRLNSAVAQAEIDSLAAAVSRQWDLPFGIQHLEGGLVLVPEVLSDSARVRSAGVDLADRLRSLDWIADVYTRWELETPATPKRAYLELFRNAWHPERSCDLYVRETEYTLITSRSQGTTHGTPYTYDTQVPLIFMGPGIRAGSLADSVRTVDLAPTLCDLLGVASHALFDGATLADRLRR